MSEPKHRLSPTEREYVSRTLGRIPTDLEERTIACLWAEFYLKYPYRDLINRAHTGVDELPYVDDSRPGSQVGPLAEICGGQRATDAATALNILLQELLCQGINPELVLVDGSGPAVADKSPAVRVAEILDSAEINRDLKIFQGQPEIQEAPDGELTLNLLAVGSRMILPEDQKTKQKGQLVLVRPAPAVAVDSTAVNAALGLLVAKPWIMGVQRASDRNCINDIVEYLNRIGAGLTIAGPGVKPVKVEDLLFNHQRLFFVHLQSGFELDLKNLLAESGLEFDEIGAITTGTNLVISGKSTTVVNIPRLLFTPGGVLYRDYQGQKPAATVNQSAIELPEKEDFNRSLLQLISNAEIVDSQAGHEGHIATASSTDGSYQVMAELRRNSRLVRTDPLLGSMILITESARWIAARGGRTTRVVVDLPILRSYDPEWLWQFEQAAQGIVQAARSLNLPPTDFNLRENGVGSAFTPVIGLLGRLPSDRQPATYEFKKKGDFIAILGSLRGELGGSEYLRRIWNSEAGTMPAVDFGMERRLQEAVVQGIEVGLVKSAYSIGRGGLATAIAKSLIGAPAGLGARIHLSRKLLPQELLFGETQGVVLITLSEDDLMEFERICMGEGVPSTTIGRVTDSGRFTFNDLIDLPVTELRAEYDVIRRWLWK
ncbi:MAG: AIR synthase-related protein [Candidatus Neomarinimicrobiota bacterium]